MATDPVSHNVWGQGIRTSEEEKKPVAKLPGLCVFLCILSTPFSISLGADWSITPGMSVAEIYTDNVTLASPGSEEDEYITEISPSVMVRGDGARLTVDFAYRMQNLLYANDSDRNDIFNQLAADASAELVQDLLFLDLSSTIGQVNTTNTERITSDNLSDTGNRSNVYTFRASPVVRHHFGTFADFETRFSFDHEDTSGGDLSGTTSYATDAHITSGRGFNVLTWSAAFNQRNSRRDSGGENVDRQSSRGELRYRLHPKFNVFTTAGQENNDFAVTGRRGNNNGAYVTAGMAWTPSPTFTLQADGGINSKGAAVTWNPTRRTSLNLSYRDQDVGSNPGSTWQGSLAYRTRRTTWTATYREVTTTTQDVLLERNVLFPIDSDTQQPILDPEGDPISLSVFVPTLTDEVFIRKRFQASMTGNTGKSTINLLAFNEDREFQESQEDEKTFGGRASLAWRFATRTSAILTGVWRRTEFRPTDLSRGREDDRLDLGLRINRRIGPNIEGNLAYRYVKNDSNLSDNDYEENRVSAQLSVTF